MSAKATKHDAAFPDSQTLSDFAYRKTDLTDFRRFEDPFSKGNYKQMKKLLEARVNPRRFAHSVGVSKIARKLAREYGCDSKVARMAGLLHDWDKALSPERLRDRVRDYDIAIDAEVLDEMPWLLHGPTAAAVLADQFPELGEEVFHSIARHTVAAIDMSDLDMIVFVADKLESARKVEAYARIARLVGRESLQTIFGEVQEAGLLYLIESGRPLNYDSIKAWNHYLDIRSR